jgi:uroporphyrinogen-III synthase
MARQSRAPTLLLTRPAPQSQRFAAEVQAAFGALPVVLSPLMQAEDLHPTLPTDPIRAVILTSETGAEAAGRLNKAGAVLPKLAFCVGDRTARAAEAAGFEARSAKGDATALVALIRATIRDGTLLHLCGEDSAGGIAETLTNGGIVTHSAIIYVQKPRPLTAEALALFGQDGPVLVPVFSPRSARLLAQALREPRRAPLWIAAISPAAAEAAAALNPDRMQTAERPDSENMLHAVAALLSAGANA